MNVRRSIVRATVAVAAASSLSLGLSSCGFDVQTNELYNPGEGVNDLDSKVDVLGAAIVSDSDGSGVLVASFANNQTKPDSVTGINAGGDDQASVTLPANTTLKPGALLNLATKGGAQAEGPSVKAGSFVTLTFVFQNAESVTMDVPVVEGGSGAYSGITPSPSS